VQDAPSMLIPMIFEEKKVRRITRYKIGSATCDSDPTRPILQTMVCIRWLHLTGSIHYKVQILKNSTIILRIKPLTNINYQIKSEIMYLLEGSWLLGVMPHQQRS
jgi:hypothetical protein